MGAVEEWEVDDPCATACPLPSLLCPLPARPFPRPYLPACLAEPLTTLGPVLCYAFRSAPYIDHALSAFGFERCLAEGNWFVSDRMGDPYSRVFQLLKDACDRAVRTQHPTPNTHPPPLAPRVLASQGCTSRLCTETPKLLAWPSRSRLTAIALCRRRGPRRSRRRRCSAATRCAPTALPMAAGPPSDLRPLS